MLRHTIFQHLGLALFLASELFVTSHPTKALDDDTISDLSLRTGTAQKAGGEPKLKVEWRQATPYSKSIPQIVNDSLWLAISTPTQEDTLTQRQATQSTTGPVPVFTIALSTALNCGGFTFSIASTYYGPNISFNNLGEGLPQVSSAESFLIGRALLGYEQLDLSTVDDMGDPCGRWYTTFTSTPQGVCYNLPSSFTCWRLWTNVPAGVRRVRQMGRI
ncbi:hypothetical protein MMC19_000356 [Ptychographa xylographoides]|nr:hypothetical protein [Ptychographa xylographoides]